MKQFTFLFIIGLCVANILATCVVQTPTGYIKGKVVTLESGKKYSEYRGIPYAESTAGKNRFKSPVPKKAWSNILVADHDGCECPRLHDGVVRGCEDCLHLNIYAPKLNPNEGPKEGLAVIVFFHGSGGAIGNGSIASFRPDYLVEHDVVLVVVQYRSGVCGYMSTGNSAAPGNYGLKDQGLATKWVKKYIKYFGGNPEEITLSGEGTGSQTANLHIFSPKPNFKNIIIASGTCLDPCAVAVGPSYHEKAKKLAELLKCPTKDSHKMIECLQNVHITDLIKASSRIFDDIEKAMQCTWRPTTEPKLPGAFLTDTPENLIQKKQWNPHCPVIIGNVKDEGTDFTKHLVKDRNLYELCKKNPVGVIKRFLDHYSPLDGMNKTDIAVKVKNHYIGVKVPESKEDFIERVTNFVTDFTSEFILLQLRKLFAQLIPNISYDYRFCYHSTINTALSFPGSLSKNLVGQGTDLFSEFPIPPKVLGSQYSSLKPSGKDHKIIDIFTDLWTNFAKTGVPTSKKLKNSHLWQPQRNTNKHLKIGNGVSIEVTLENKYPNRVKFLEEHIPQHCMEL